ncbi:MAG: hypothetical protein HYW49_12075 [Deltaproteobacteria bacterium]|nr:hypothetical protein [Deltaproteobacteria bacterium]
MKRELTLINTMKPAAAPGHQETKGDVLKRITDQYGAGEQKEREAVKKLGKDEFFKLMVTQMQHQDPMKPYQNEEMAAQMAQFSSLEQMLNVNQNLDKLAQAQLPLQQLGAAGLIGKYVTADSSRMMHTEGKPTDLKFDLTGDAHKVRVAVLNERGETVREIEAENLKKGEAKIAWDGKAANKMPAKSGEYSIQVAAEADNGKPIPIQTQKTEVVNGVSFDGKETVLLTGDPQNPRKMLLKNISKIVDPSQTGAAGAAKAYSLPEAAQAMSPEALPGRFSGYTQVELPSQKPQVPPARASDANPAALDAAAGKLKYGGSKDDLSDANPAAMKFASSRPAAVNLADIPEVDSDENSRGAETSAGKSVQSSQDGSTAGKWNE